MLTEREHQQLLNKAIDCIDSGRSFEEIQQAIVDLLHSEVNHYNWVGFYWGNEERRVLTLGPFAGAPTEHTEIPYGVGVCGSVAESNTTMNVVDVSALENYLACSIETKSELVVPIILNNNFVGQIDIDSHLPSAFNLRDERLIQGIARRLAELMPN